MKRTLYFVAIMAGLAACTSGNGKGSGAADTMTVKQKESALNDSSNFTTAVWVDSTFKDIGKVKKGQIVEISFTVKNTGNKPLIISDVVPGCGCTLGEKPEKPIMPGQQDKVVAKFNSEGQMPGVHNKNMVVKANTNPATDHVLNFKVDVTE